MSDLKDFMDNFREKRGGKPPLPPNSNRPDYPYIVIADGKIMGFFKNFREAELESRIYRYDSNYYAVYIAEVKMRNEVVYAKQKV